jgi:transmembrane sensor
MNIELYKKMCKGDCTAEETAQVLQWLQEDPSRVDAALLEELQQDGEEKMPAEVREQMLAFFESKGIAAPVIEEKVISMPQRSTFRRNWWVAAAAVAVLMVAGWWWSTEYRKTPVSMAWVQVRNTESAIRQLTLPDSTKVWLRQQATLWYRDDFTGHSQREVRLSGEGYFKVSHDTLHPFVVQAGELQTVVLGTEFNIEAYPEEQSIKVSLQKGKVRVSAQRPGDSAGVRQVLQPGQVACYSRGNGALSVKSSALNNPAAWTSEGLVLNDVPLPDALRRIALKYNQPLHFDSVRAAQHQHVTAYFQEMDFGQVLTQLGFIAQFHTTKKGNSYLITWP